MPAVRAFPILSADNLRAAAQGVGDKFHAGKARAKELEKVQEWIGEPLAASALSKKTPELVEEFTTYNKHDKADGVMSSVKIDGQIFTFHQKFTGGGDYELRLYPPLAPREYDAKALRDGGVNKLYDTKKVPTITIMTGGRENKCSINEERAWHLDGDYATSVSECAMSLIERARAAYQAGVDAVNARRVEIEPGVYQDITPKASLLDRMLAAKPKMGPGPLEGVDLVEVVQWRGLPIAVTSDPDGKGPVHVSVRRRLDDGSAVWWPIAVPDAKAFPTRACGVMLDGDTLTLAGGIDADGKPSTARWTLDVKQAFGEDFPAGAWKQGASLSEAAAWPAAVASDREQLVIGGVAEFVIKRQNNADVKVPTTRRTFQMGWMDWRTKSAPPADTAGSHALLVDNVVFVGPGSQCDGAVVAYDKKKSRWCALPALPEKLGMGQLHLDGNRLLYTAGFDEEGDPQKMVYALRLDDPFAQWSEIGRCAALQGKTRTVEIEGKLAAVAVTQNGSALLHLE